ncbi:MAG: hypothetical protein J6Z38_06505 [Lachnospiraceae bacterium]|nr:hypothetical protein [Lachnospiraceae bacterium]
MEGYEAFKERLTEGLLQKGLNAELCGIEKENGVRKEGLVLRRSSGASASPVLYTAPLFALFKDETLSFGEILEKAAETLKSPVPGVLSEALLSKENILGNIVPTIVAKKAGGGAEGEAAGFLDLSVVYRLYIRGEDLGEGLMVLTPRTLYDAGVLGTDGLSSEALMERAKENMKRLLPADVLSFSGEFCVLSNRSGFYGASEILDTDCLSGMAEKLHGSYFILPSSKHEQILMPEGNVEDPSVLKDIVRQVNRTAVEREDFLSDSVYFFDSAEKAVAVFDGGASAVRKAYGAAE